MKKNIKIFILIIVVIFPIMLIACKNEEPDIGGENTVTISFNSNGGTEIESQTIKYGEKVSKPEGCEKKGYTLDGWYLNDEVWSFVGFSVTEDICLEAKWIPISYTIKYEITSGQQNPDNPNNYTIEDEEILLKELTQNLSLIFDGWYLDSELTQPIKRINCNICENIILYPKWTDEFYIRTKEDFLKFSTNNLYIDKKIFLENDIDFSNQVIVPIMTFKGIFNGNGHKLSNFILNSTFSHCGLFEQVSGAQIKNIALENFTINQTSQSVTTGALISNANDTLVENCYVKNGNFNITCDYGVIGGLIGSFVSSEIATYVKNCYSECDITANADIGGLIGSLCGTPYWTQTKQTLVLNCYSKCDIVSINEFGSVAGLISRTFNEGIEIRNCFSMSNLESGKTEMATSKLAGIVRFSELEEIIIEKCYFINNAILKENEKTIANTDIYDSQKIDFETYSNIKNNLQLLWNDDWSFETEYPILKIFN